MKILFTCVLFFLIKNLVAQTPIDALNAAPNPFSKRTQITYTIVSADTVTIKIMNMLGQNILSPVTKVFLQPGVYSDSLIMDSFPAGIYLASMEVGNKKP